ncbi:hypothetical protein [Mesobacillus subterraneus]|uniref:DUF4253 domain-containing protein n=1 Tax=Mesobacillus subterraneus TaxID=285983 RepID=A0A3R9KWP9_9BACI|nr:hypothetical protein [Mesobacillus subterraneus]RSD27811.1 hypothetical protein EJA10_08540 [Mesobacillus subterraneus]
MRKQLAEKIFAQGYPDAKTAPIVSLEDFFTGNTDEGSIGCNLLEHPGIDTFNNILWKIRGQENVQDVLVEIMEIEDDENYWAFSERLYILTSAEQDTVECWVNVLEPSEVDDEGYIFGIPPLAPELRDGYKVYSVWWD